MTPLDEQKRALLLKWHEEGFPEPLINAFAEVPRELFLPEEQRANAYRDQPLPIGFDQTISQPSTIMLMLKLLEVASLKVPGGRISKDSSAAPRQTRIKVLEIGAGSGYVCALLAELGCAVTGIEIVPELAVQASRILTKLGYADRVSIHAGDGSGGWEEDAPYDRILISAGAPDVPRHLFWQMKPRGILVVPVGRVEQRMLVCRKKNGEVTEEDHGAFLFVPLTGKWGVEDEDVPNLPFV
jgi:protein-L-isoaspartate(D-aspartate) O-methyltransferase